MNEEKKLCIIDRFEGEFAVIEFGRQTFNFPRELLSHNLKEGDIIDFTISFNELETNKRKEAIEKLTQTLFKD